LEIKTLIKQPEPGAHSWGKLLLKVLCLKQYCVTPKKLIA